MYYKVDENSKTGKKLNKFKVNILHCRLKAEEAVKNLGMQRWASPQDSVSGGIAAFIYDGEPNHYLVENFEKVKENYYVPSRHTELGRKIALTIDRLPIVTASDLRKAVDYRGDVENVMLGFSSNGTGMFGISTLDEWNAELHPDCLAITEEEFNQLFNPVK